MMIMKMFKRLEIRIAIRLYQIPFSPKIYSIAAAARVLDSIFMYTNDEDRPRLMTAVSTCSTNQINRDTVKVTNIGKL